MNELLMVMASACMGFMIADSLTDWLLSKLLRRGKRGGRSD